MADRGPRSDHWRWLALIATGIAFSVIPPLVLGYPIPWEIVGAFCLLLSAGWALDEWARRRIARAMRRIQETEEGR